MGASESGAPSPGIDALVAAAGTFHPWDSMAPRALAAIARRGPFLATAETGCGGSTIVFSQLSRRHTSFAIEGENASITQVRARSDFNAGAVAFVEGPTKETVPAFRSESPLDLVLLDGPHAYPLPQLEYACLFPMVRRAGWLVVDDIQIRSVHELFSFLRQESSVILEEVVVRTAFFRKVTDGTYPAGPDGWWLQGVNRRPVWRYAWRDRLRRLLGRGNDRPRPAP